MTVSRRKSISQPAHGWPGIDRAIEWNAKALDRKWHFHHLAVSDRLAASGVAWAHEARRMEAPLLYVAAGGFSDDFVAAARASRETVCLWSLRDIFAAGES